MQETNIQALQQEIRGASNITRTIKIEVAKVLVGQEELVNSLLIGLLCNGHILVEGLPGLAKTLAIKTLAQAVGGTFARLQFTPDLLPADLTGTTIYNPGDHTFSVKQGPIFANIILADEINRAPAKVQSALLEAMQEHQVTLGGQTYTLPEPFLVMATQNPIEQEGTYPLPEAQVDRFMLKALITYPTRQEEQEILDRMAHPEVSFDTVQVVEPRDVLAARAYVDRIYVDPKVKEYILDLVFASRGAAPEQLSERQRDARLEGLGDLIEYGASPRATLALTLGAKAAAFLEGRAYVVPQDVKDVAPAVLRHRIIPTYEAEAENLTGDDIVGKLLDELRTP
ncbi:MAG: AAA domain-containing protein [Kiritimatiellaeota bacterium]|nr:AAA domain-containing protein [Kiritimatiellota bacterium]